MVQPHGRKLAFLAERGVTTSALKAWKREYLFGSLELGLVPRDTSKMSEKDGAEVRALEVQLAAERAARERERDELAAEIARLQAANEALGKAIGLMQDHDVRRDPTANS